MEHYDFQIIEGCHVYSYIVEGPAHPMSQHPKKAAISAQKKQTDKKMASFRSIGVALPDRLSA